MKAIDYRNTTWAEIQKNLSGMRRRVYDAWLMHGPGTTTEVALKANISILTFRPRSTELYQMGLIRLCNIQKAGTCDGGTYIGVREIDAKFNVEARSRKQADQTELGFETTSSNLSHRRA